VVYDEYRYRDGSRFRVKAQVAGEAIAAIEARDGIATAAAVVEDARDEASGMHDEFFRDDDGVWAQRGREEHARHLMRSLFRVENPNDTAETQVQEWVHIEHPELGSGYMNTRAAISDDERWAQVLEDAAAGLRMWQARFDRLSNLPGLFVAIDAAAKMIEGKAAKLRNKAAKKTRRPVAAKV
jgi:hypothetical protein